MVRNISRRLLLAVLLCSAFVVVFTGTAGAAPAHAANNCSITYWHLQHESGWSAWTNPDGRQNVISVRADSKLFVELSYYDGSYCSYWYHDAVFYVNTNGGSANCSYHVRSQLYIPAFEYYNTDTYIPSNACNQNWHVSTPAEYEQFCYAQVGGMAEYLDFGDNASTSGGQC